MIDRVDSGALPLRDIPKCYTCKSKHVNVIGEECDECYAKDLVGTSVRTYGKQIIGMDNLFK